MPLSKKKLPKPLTIRKAKKLRNTPQKPDVPEMKEYPLNIFVMALCDMCLKHMSKLGVTENVAIHISRTEESKNAIICFINNKETYTLKGGKWTKIKED